MRVSFDSTPPEPELLTEGDRLLKDIELISKIQSVGILNDFAKDPSVRQQIDTLLNQIDSYTNSAAELAIASYTNDREVICAIAKELRIVADALSEWFDVMDREDLPVGRVEHYEIAA
jgi:hypothetical protein